MIKFLTLRKELRKQATETELKKARLQYSSEKLKRRVHDKLTSPAALATSFAAGAATGWFAIPSNDRDSEDISTTEQQSTKPNDQSSTLLQDTFNRALGIGVTLAMSELTDQATQFVVRNKMNKQQRQGTNRS